MTLVQDGMADWQQRSSKKVKSVTVGGITYDYESLGKPNVMMVNSFGDLTKNADQYRQILCADHFDGFSPEVFIHLGPAEEGHRLLFTAERGTIIVINDEHSFSWEVAIVYLGDGSWGVLSDSSYHRKPVSWLRGLYKAWLKEVISRLAYMGMIEDHKIYHPRFSRLIFDNQPKGLILIKN